MKKMMLSSVAALALAAVPAFAADMPVKAAKAPVAEPSPFDIAFGGAIMNDYIWRGITQSNHRPSVAAYFEPRYNLTKDIQLYVGLSGESIDFPNRAAAEIDFYGGVRPTFGPLAFDIGLWYYYYPGGKEFNGLGGPETCTNGFFSLGFCNVAKSDVSFLEVYGHATWTVNELISVGANVFYTPSYLNSGAWGLYYSGTAKLTAPSNMLPEGIGAYLSGEIGRQDFGTTDSFYGNVPLPDYTTWNVGIGFTWKVFTLDLRYWDTDLSKADCNVITGDHTATFDPGSITATNPSGLASNWCGARFVARLSADLTLATLK
ncbi:MAG: hypothetical protein IRY89_03280 [Pseudolabrys sp.]|jgi:uncharacterized protein (TIGR02001 family)|nr:hypothetical protein [Pseudolabrys sp.]